MTKEQMKEQIVKNRKLHDEKLKAALDKLKDDVQI